MSHDFETFTTGVLPASLPFCSAVRAGGTVYVSGNIGNPAGELSLVEGGIAAETRQALAHMEKALQAAGSSKERVVKCLIFLADMADFQVMNETYEAFFEGHRPARSTVAVAGLAIGAKIEIECTALAG
jgi:2-iminobutanoate/2-iminopropanoate deaminase